MLKNSWSINHLSTNSTAIIGYYRAEHINEIVTQKKSSAMTPMELVVDYMDKHINLIDETMKEWRIKYPNLFSKS